MKRHTLVLVASVALLLSVTACKTDQPTTTPDPTTATAVQPEKAPDEAPPEAPPAAAMAKAEIDKPAPDFELTSLAGEKIKLSDHRGKVVVLEWFNPDCPFVRAAHERGNLKTAAKEWTDKGIVWLAINSGAPGKQGHGKETNTTGKTKFGLDHPILFDEDGKVGKAYNATRTPQMFVIDKEGKLAYQGGLDNTGSGDPTDADPLVNYTKNAIEAVSAGKPVDPAETKAWGCSVKYGG